MKKSYFGKSSIQRGYQRAVALNICLTILIVVGVVKRMKFIEKVYLILSNYIVASFITPIGYQMIPSALHIYWTLLQIYLWIISPLIILIAVSGEGKNEEEKGT